MSLNVPCANGLSNRQYTAESGHKPADIIRIYELKYSANL